MNVLAKKKGCSMLPPLCAVIFAAMLVAVAAVNAGKRANPPASAEPDTTSEPAAEAASLFAQCESGGTVSPLPTGVLRVEACEDLPPAALQEVVDVFLYRCMEAQITLETIPLADLFAGETANSLLNQAALDLSVGTRRLQPLDLTLLSGQYGVTYLECEGRPDGTYYLRLCEDNAVQFAYLEGRTSFSSGIEHQFTLAREYGAWKIVEHTRVEDGFLLLEELLGEYGADEADVGGYQLRLGTIVENLLDDAAMQIALRAVALDKYLADPESRLTPDLTWTHDYDRAAALAYAAEWVDETALVRNPAWDVYDDLGGNCANFTSQVLEAGGIPMDYTGSAQWKYFGKGINAWRQPYGRSASWTGVGSFREYALVNTGFGLAAWVGANAWAAQPGDILQVGIYGGARHAVVVTEVVYDENGAPVDYLLASNTTDHIDFPASAYVYTSWIVIRICGWND